MADLHEVVPGGALPDFVEEFIVAVSLIQRDNQDHPWVRSSVHHLRRLMNRIFEWLPDRRTLPLLVALRETAVHLAAIIEADTYIDHLPEGVWEKFTEARDRLHAESPAALRRPEPLPDRGPSWYEWTAAEVAALPVCDVCDMPIVEGNPHPGCRPV